MQLKEILSNKAKGIDDIDYTIKKENNLFRAKLKVRIHDHSFIIYKKDLCLDNLLKKLQTSIEGLANDQSSKWRNSA